MNVTQVFLFAMLGVVTAVVSSFLPHSDEAGRTIATTVCNIGTGIAGAACALATAQLRTRSKKPQPGLTADVPRKEPDGR